MSYIYFTNPVDGLVSNLRWMLTRPQEAALILDSWALIVTLILAAASVGFRAHRRLGLQVFTWGFLLLFLSKMNFYYGTDVPYYSQSFGRYALTLFPLTILVADGCRRLPGVPRAFVLTAAVILLALTSALFTLALAGP
jgi:multisubunit Na+/H+ antiporter MnhC subunit